MAVYTEKDIVTNSIRKKGRERQTDRLTNRQIDR